MSDRPLYCLKGPKGLCWWTVRPSPQEAWEAGYPRSINCEPVEKHQARMRRIQLSELIECVKVRVEETSS